MAVVRSRESVELPTAEVEAERRELSGDAATLQAPEAESEVVANSIGSLLQRVAGSSVRDIDQLIAELQAMRTSLESEGARVQREIIEYAHLSQSAMQTTKVIAENLAGRKVLVLGAGETSERTARALVSRGVADLRVSNRSAERALQLAQVVGGAAVPFAQWRDQCRKIDILITSTSSDEQLLVPDNLAPMLCDRVDRPLFIIDIAVPRDVDPAVNEMDGVYLYDIDSLQSVAEQSLALRRQQVAAAEKIINEHVDDFQKRFVSCGDVASSVHDKATVSDSALRASEL